MLSWAGIRSSEAGGLRARRAGVQRIVAGDAERLEMSPVAGKQHQAVSAGGCRDGDVGEAWMPAGLSSQIPCSILATLMVEM